MCGFPAIFFLFLRFLFEQRVGKFQSLRVSDVLEICVQILSYGRWFYDMSLRFILIRKYDMMEAFLLVDLVDLSCVETPLFTGRYLMKSGEPRQHIFFSVAGASSSWRMQNTAQEHTTTQQQRVLCR